MEEETGRSVAGESTSGEASRSAGVWEIEEEGEIKPQEGLRFRGESFDFQGEDAVYVAVGRQNEKSSMDALVWTLNNLVTPSSSTLLFLIHILPETKFIPTPLGKIPVSQVNAEQKANHEIQKRSETNKFLEKFIALCSSKQVKVDTVAVESDDEAKAISELVDVLKIRKLVLGITQDDLRKMERKKGGNSVTIADEVVKRAANFCEMKIVCEGREVSELVVGSPRTSAPRRPEKTEISPSAAEPTAEKDREKRKFGCFVFFR